MKSFFRPLQITQLHHDQHFHADIYQMDIYTKLKHMVLHFYKYTGQLCEALASQDKGKQERILLDAFIIGLSTANALKIKLDDSICSSPMTLPNLVLQLMDNGPNRDMVTGMAIIGGRMAKLLESHDHCEAISFRSEIETLTVAMIKQVLVAMVQVEPTFSLHTLLENRYKEIEDKCRFL